MVTLHQILDCLHRERLRATYGAVAEVLGQPHQRVARDLRDYTKRGCWIVGAKTGQPTGYTAKQLHPDLYRTPRVIKSAAELSQLLGPVPADDELTDIFLLGNVPASCRNMSPHAAAQALEEVRDSRRRQQDKLQNRLRAAVTTIILYVAMMAVFTTASGKFASLTAVLMFVGAFMLLVTLALIGSMFRLWNDAPEINCSSLLALSKHSRPLVTDLYLIDQHIESYNRNADTLKNVLRALWLHIAVAVVGGVVAVSALLEIVPALINQPDPPAGAAHEAPLHQPAGAASEIGASQTAGR